MYWNFYAGLYTELTEAEIELIEHANKIRRLGRYDEARSILYGHSFGKTDPLVVVFEKSNLELRLGYEVESLRILDEDFHQRITQHGLEKSTEGLTIRFKICEGAMKVHGTVKDSLALARRLKDELQAIPIADWTDLEIECAVTFFSVLRTAYLQSNWVDESKDFYIHQDGQTLSSKTIQDHLLSQGKYWQCLELIRMEKDFLSRVDTAQRYHDFIGHYETISTPESEPMILLGISANLFAAEDLLRVSDIEAAKAYLQNARSMLESTTWIRKLDLPNLNLERLELETREPLTIKDVPDQFLIAQKCQLQKDRLLETQTLAQILITLNRINMLERNEVWESYWKKMKDAMRKLHDNPYIGAFSAALALGNQHNSRSSTDYSGAVQCLYETAIFEAKYPKFDSPFFSHLVFTVASRAAFDLGRKDEWLTYEAKKIAAHANNRTYSEELYWRYRSTANPLAWRDGIFDVIISWLKLELSNSSISPTLVRKILLPTSSNGVAEENIAGVLPLLDHTNVEAFEKHLFGWPDWLDCDTWERRFAKYRTWLWFHPRSIPRAMRHSVIGDLQQIRSFQVNFHVHEKMQRSLVLYSKKHKLEQFDSAQLELRQCKIRDLAFNLDLCRSLDPKASPATDQALFSTEWTLMLARRSMDHCHKAYKLRLITDDSLKGYQQYFEKAYDRVRVSDVQRRSMTLSILAGVMRSRYGLFGSLPPDASLEIWQKYDDDYVRERQKKSVLRGADDLTARTALFSTWTDHKHYEHAMGICLESLGMGFYRKGFHNQIQLDPSVEAYEVATIPAKRSQTELVAELVRWSQKRKARTVTEVLGAEVLIPERLLEEATADPLASSLLDEEKQLEGEMDKGSSNLFDLQSSLEELRQRMRACGALKQIMNLRDGQAVTIPELKQLSKDLGPDVLIVDFVFIGMAYSLNTREFCAMLYRQGEMVDMEMIPESLNLAGLQRWIETFMDKDKPFIEEDASSHLQHLLPFLNATIRRSNPRDTILFSLTGPLNHVPLHAIEVDGQPLIARNKVVYTQSMTLFRNSMRSASNANKPKGFAGILAVQALGATDSARPEAPSMRFASRMGVEALGGPRLTKASLLEAASKSSLIHFYGHVNFEEKRPLSSSLEIRDLPAERITVRDIFDIRLPRGSHVTLVGCSSGRSEVGVNDDILGLSTGLFYAGASSVISTLWKIQMDDGDDFQEALYDSLFQQSRDSKDLSERFLDFATALQSAVLKLRSDKHGNPRTPYHWAGFTLQGCWDKFPCPSWTLHDQ